MLFIISNSLLEMSARPSGALQAACFFLWMPPSPLCRPLPSISPPLMYPARDYPMQMTPTLPKHPQWLFTLTQGGQTPAQPRAWLRDSALSALVRQQKECEEYEPAFQPSLCHRGEHVHTSNHFPIFTMWQWFLVFKKRSQNVSISV